MALTPRLGSSTPSSTPNASPPESASDIVANMPFITDSALNKYAIDTSQYVSATEMIVGFMKGHRITVTYYRLLREGPDNGRNNVADLPMERNVLRAEYQKISNLEITLPKGFDFTVNPQQTSVSLKGQAMFYPGMNPNIGDIFLMGTGDGRVGLCRISSVTPGSWRQDRIYTVDFVIQEFLNPETAEALEGMVTVRNTFSKANYLGGTASLLSEDTYAQLSSLQSLRTTLCRFYHQTFFDLSLGSYVRPDGAYDPWVVQFMTHKIRTTDVPVRAKNLIGIKATLYQQTLWARLEDSNNLTLYGVFPNYTLCSYGQTRMGVFVTELANRSILFPALSTDINTLPYLYSPSFYGNTASGMSAEELLIYKAITQRTMGDLTSLFTNYLDTAYALSAENQFYKIPIYIHLMDMALQSQYREIDAPSMSSGGAV